MDVRLRCPINFINLIFLKTTWLRTGCENRSICSRCGSTNSINLLNKEFRKNLCSNRVQNLTFGIFAQCTLVYSLFVNISFLSPAAALILAFQKPCSLEVNKACIAHMASTIFFCRTWEMCDDIRYYLSEANLLPSHQSAYKKHNSTETALLKVCSDIISHLDMGDCALLAFLDLSAAFDTVDKRILFEWLSRSFGIEDIALRWFQSYLTNRTEYVLFNGNKSSIRVVQFGVPQESVLGPLLFVLYTSDLEKIAENHNLDAHFYADDSQLYIFRKPQFADSAQTRLIACLDDFAQWMSANRLKLNPDKTEFMRCATARRLPQLTNEVVTFGNSTISPATTVRNLGVVVDQKFSFQTHVNKTVSSCFYQLRRLKSSVKALPFETAKTLVNSFVISRIDYCNSLLAGTPQCLLSRLQRVMNKAARMLCRCSRGDHISRIIKERLHWLRIPQRIQFKLCLLVYKSLHGKAPVYLSNLVNQVDTIDTRRRLQSATDDHSQNTHELRQACQLQWLGLSLGTVCPYL